MDAVEDIGGETYIEGRAFMIEPKIRFAGEVGELQRCSF